MGTLQIKTEKDGLLIAIAEHTNMFRFPKGCTFPTAATSTIPLETLPTAAVPTGTTCISELMPKICKRWPRKKDRLFQKDRAKDRKTTGQNLPKIRYERFALFMASQP